MKKRIIALGEKKFFWIVALFLAFTSLFIEFIINKWGYSILDSSRGLLLTTFICVIIPIVLWNFLNRREK